MAEWIGQLLGQLPNWIFIPVFIVFVAICIVLWTVYALGGASYNGNGLVPLPSKKHSLKKGKQ